MSTRETPHLTDERLDDYVDGALSDSERAFAEEHLASCERCRRAVGDTRELIATAQRQRVPVAAPAELWPLIASSTIHLAAVRRQVLASMRGLLVTDHLHRFPDYHATVGPWLADGTVRHVETVVDGLDQAPAALIGLLRGAGVGVGKMLVRQG